MDYADLKRISQIIKTVAYGGRFFVNVIGYEREIVNFVSNALAIFSIKTNDGL